MEMRPLGRTGIQVSKICLGTMTWGEQNTQADAFEQMDYALTQGINFFDTAEFYSVPSRAETYGHTEQIIGRWLRERGARERIILASKITGPGVAWIDPLRGGRSTFTRANIAAALDASLKRLQTDYIDLYQLHWPERKTNYFGRLGYRHQNDVFTPFDEVLRGLDEQIRAGKIRYIGLSNETPWGVANCLQLAETLGLPRIVTIQNPYNLLNRTFEIGLAEFAHREQTGLLAYSPLGFGVLSGKYLRGAQPPQARLSLRPDFTRYTNPQAVAATEAYVALAQKHRLDPAQMALAYVNSRPFLTSTIIGATTMTQLKANIDSADLELGEEILTGIEAIHQDQPNPAP